MSGITNLSRSGNMAILEAAILLVLALAAILIIHKFQRVSAVSTGNQKHSVLLNTGNNTALSNDSSPVNSGPAESSSSNTTKVTVNGQSIPVPQNGATSQTVENEDGGTSRVETTNQQSSSNESGTATNHSSTTINVHSSSKKGGN